MFGALAFAPLLRRLEAEQERWFFWVPVLLGVGIGAYFSLPFEPHLATALGPFAVALVLRSIAPARLPLVLALNALLAVTAGFAVAKLRVEWVRAPVLARELRSVEVRGTSSSWSRGPCAASASRWLWARWAMFQRTRGPCACASPRARLCRASRLGAEFACGQR
jgi:hypothetical protein